MLVETKCITEMAKIYGSTWMVTSIVIAVVLMMAFIANLLVIKNKIKRTSCLLTFNFVTNLRVFHFDSWF